jgi:hypothetical protein
VVGASPELQELSAVGCCSFWEDKKPAKVMTLLGCSCLLAPAPANGVVKTAETSFFQGRLENHRNGFKTRQSSNLRPFSIWSSRFSVQTGAQNKATTQFESAGLLC